MQKLLTKKARWMLAGWVLFLALVLFHPFVLDAMGKEHPPDCPLCVYYASATALTIPLLVLPFSIVFGFFLFTVYQKLISTVFSVSFSRAPPAIF